MKNVEEIESSSNYTRNYYVGNANFLCYARLYYIASQLCLDKSGSSQVPSVDESLKLGLLSSLHRTPKEEPTPSRFGRPKHIPFSKPTHVF